MGVGEDESKRLGRGRWFRVGGETGGLETGEPEVDVGGVGPERMASHRKKRWTSFCFFVRA